MSRWNKENPFLPENPHDNFKVTVVDAHGFLLHAVSQFDNGEQVTFPISEGTNLDGLLLDRETSILYLFAKQDGPMRMSVMTSLFLSETMYSPSPRTFTTSEIGQVQDILARNSIISSLGATDEDITLTILHEGLELQVIFPKIVRETKPQTIQIFLLGLKENQGFEPEKIEEISEFPRVQSPDNFVAMMEVYAQLYSGLLNALYESFDLHINQIEIQLCAPTSFGRENTQTLESLLRQPLLETGTQDSRLTFDDIAGQDEAVDLARQFVDFINHSEEYSEYGDDNAAGILLIGPPGTGKSLLARIIADEANATLFEIKISDISSKWYGEAEQRMQAVFDAANEAASDGGKAIILIEEFDSMFALRDESHEVTKRIAQVYLNNTGGKQANPNVFIIGSSNRPDGIDEAFKRSGRIDAVIEMGLPDNAEKRLDILRIHIRHKENARKNPNLEIFDPNIDWGEIAEATEGMSGADLENLIKTACRQKTYEKRTQNLPKRQPVTSDDLKKVIDTIMGSRHRKEKPRRKLGFDLGSQVDVKNKGRF